VTRDCFPDAALTQRDVAGSWAGIRPLVFEAGKTTRQMSREDQVWTSPAGLVTVAGGKLTTYRPMARRILEGVARSRGVDLPGSELTGEVPLPGCPAEDLSTFRARIREELARYEIPDRTLQRIEFLYGTEVEVLLSYGSESPDWMAPLADDLPALRGEVRLAIEWGMARTLADAMDRRMALLLFAERGGTQGASTAATIAGDLLGWNPTRREQEINSYLELVGGHGPRGEGTVPNPGS